MGLHSPTAAWRGWLSTGRAVSGCTRSGSTCRGTVCGWTDHREHICNFRHSPSVSLSLSVSFCFSLSHQILFLPTNLSLESYFFFTKKRNSSSKITCSDTFCSHCAKIICNCGITTRGRRFGTVIHQHNMVIQF